MRGLVPAAAGNLFGRLRLLLGDGLLVVLHEKPPAYGSGSNRRDAKQHYGKGGFRLASAWLASSLQDTAAGGSDAFAASMDCAGGMVAARALGPRVTSDELMPTAANRWRSRLQCGPDRIGADRRQFLRDLFAGLIAIGGILRQAFEDGAFNRCGMARLSLAGGTGSV